MFSFRLLLLGLVFEVTVVSGFPQDYVSVGSGSSSSSALRENEGDPQACARDLIDWCKNQQFPKGSFIATSSYNSRLQTMISCTADSNKGFVCSKNSQLWFQCYPNNTLSYKGDVLDGESVQQADDQVCAAKEIASGYILGGSGSFNETVFNAQMDEFHARMGEFEESMQQMARDLQNALSGMGTDLSNMFQ